MSSPTAPIRLVPRAEARTRASVPVLPTRCSTCHLKELCLPAGLEAGDVERLDGLRFARRRVKEGEVLLHQGEDFHFVYAVRSGTFKASLTWQDGREQVTGFFIAGEMMGLDGLAEGRHASTVVALEDAEICAIPYAHLRELGMASLRMQHAVSRLMSREIVRDHSLMALLGTMTAEERVASFLLNLSQRMQQRGYSPREFHLRMSRAEIGSYLGLKLETVSRTFSAFQQRGLLEVNKKHIRIEDLEGLEQAFAQRIH